MRKYKIPLFLVLVFSLLTIDKLPAQGKEEKDFFNKTPNRRGPQDSRTLVEKKQDAEKDRVGTVIDGSKNPELIPEYILWEKFCATVYRLNHKTAEGAPTLDSKVLPDQRTVEGLVGLNPEQSKAIATTASHCSMKVAEILEKHRKQAEALHGGKSMAELSDAQKRALTKNARSESEARQALMENCKADILAQLTPDQQEKFQAYLRQSVARGMRLGIPITPKQ